MPKETYWHIEIPGKACDAIPCEYFQTLIYYLEGNFEEKFKFTRLDFAFDHVDFTPQQVEQAICEDKIRSLAKRESLKVHKSPFAACDNGDIGTYTVEFGSRTSERMIRAYNKRGFTRLEFEMKDKRADRVARELLSAATHDDWFELMIGHIRDYIDFKTDWWEGFIDGVARANLTVSKPKEVSMEKLHTWIDRQVSPSFSVLYDLMSKDDFEKFMRHARKRRNPLYETLVAEARSEVSGEGSIPPGGRGTQEPLQAEGAA